MNAIFLLMSLRQYLLHLLSFRRIPCLLRISCLIECIVDAIRNSHGAEFFTFAKVCLRAVSGNATSEIRVVRSRLGGVNIGFATLCMLSVDVDGVRG